MHYVTLADGRKIGLGKYVAAWKACRELPANTPIGRGISGYGQTAGEALVDLRRGLEDRINRHIPGYGVGRKWSRDWYFATWNASRAINNPRLIVRWLPADMMEDPAVCGAGPIREEHLMERQPQQLVARIKRGSKYRYQTPEGDWFDVRISRRYPVVSGNNNAYEMRDVVFGVRLDDGTVMELT